MGRLDEQRVLVTHADRYLGPPIVELFGAEGAAVTASEAELTGTDDADELLAASGPFDVVVANFAGPKSRMPVTNMMVDAADFTDDSLQDYLEHLVWPLVRVVRASLQQMYRQGAGKIVAITSATPERAIPGLSAYSAARGAQNAFIQAAGAEAAPRNVQLNAVGPAHIENNMYYTDEMLADQDVRDSFEQQIPAGRLGKGPEGAQLALALATSPSDFLAGQVIPLSGGWAT